MGANASPYSSARAAGHQEPIREPEQLLIPGEIQQGPTAGTSWAQQRKEKGKSFSSVASDAEGPRSAMLQVWSRTPSHVR